jgi:hypothetical protein
MDGNQEIREVIRAISEDILRNPRSNYHSWEHCFRFFTSEPKDLDLASLHLGFFLASWGMYRGSAAIRNFDYLIHRPVAEVLLNSRYDTLRGASLDVIECQLDDLLWPLLEQIVHDGLYPRAVNVSDTLVSKILLGTLGCMPAYDRYFVTGIRSIGIAPSLTKPNFRSLLRFCQ